MTDKKLIVNAYQKYKNYQFQLLRPLWEDARMSSKKRITQH